MNCINKLTSINKIKTKNSLFLTMFLLMNCCFLFAQDTLSDETLNQLKKLKNELSQAEKEQDAIRNKAYDENPSLKYSVELLRESEQKDDDITQDRIEVMRFLKQQAKTNPKIKQLYWDLNGAVGESLEYDNAKSFLEDSQKRPILLAIIKAYSSDDKNDMTEEELVESYLSRLKALQEPNKTKIQEIEKMEILSAFVLDHVETEVRVSSLRSLYDTYIRLNKPEELQFAEDKVSNLKAKMTKLFPNWQKLQIELNATNEYCTKKIPADNVKKALAKINKNHPRLFLTDQQIPTIKQRIEESDELKALHKTILEQADQLIKKQPLKRVKIGKRILKVSREALSRILTLGWAYRTTENELYFERAQKELITIAEFKDWNPTHFLDVAEMTTAMAIGYDWFYNKLSDQSRKTIKQAILEKGITPSLNDKYNFWINNKNNWNPVCHGGMVCGVLAALDDKPELAEFVINRALEKVTIAMAQYMPDGAYPEGPGYWFYGTTYTAILIEALDSALGTDFGLSKNKAFANSPNYYMHSTGPLGMHFNYSDSKAPERPSPVVYWFADKYKNPSLTWNQYKLLKRAISQNKLQSKLNRFSVLTLLWASQPPQKPAQLSWMGQGINPVAMFRSSWKKNAVYLAIKGGTPSSSHAHMDIGSFVIDAQGLRWALDLGPEIYNKIESQGIQLWDARQSGQRWKIYRYSNFSHNTLTVNNELQQVNGFAPIIRYSADKKFPHTAIDMTQVYKGQLKKAIRGAALLPTGQILIQDEIQALDKPAKIRWAMTTPATINIISAKKAILTQKNKTMQFHVISDAHIKLETYSTQPPNAYDSPNPNTSRIGFEANLKPNQTAVLKVLIIPSKASPAKIENKTVEQWSPPLLKTKCKF